MFDSDDISVILEFLTSDKFKNLEEIETLVTGDLHYIDSCGNSLLHSFVIESCFEEEPKRLLALQSLLDYGLNPNHEDITGQNFIQRAMEEGTTEQFMLQILAEAFKYGLKANHQDYSGNSMMHSAIFSDNYDIDELINIYNLLMKNSFNKNILNKEGMDIVKAMEYCSKYSFDEIQKFQSVVGLVENFKLKKDSNKYIKELEQYGKILTNQNYKFQPAIGRDKEFMNILITLAKRHENPLLVGESGVGKTVLCEELAYQIINKNVPKFLEDKIIVETMPSLLVSGCEYVGQFEDKMHKFLDLCDKYQVIVVINEIHNIYGTGSSKNSDSDMAEMLKAYLEKTNIKIIGTTTNKEYQTYFAESSLKRRFGKIDIKEPDELTLNMILYKVIQDNLDDYDMNIDEDIKEIANIVTSLTQKKHRVYNDQENNPALAISIIDTAFAVAKVYNKKTIDKNDFIRAVESNYRLYESAKKKAINELDKLLIQKPKQKNKIIAFKKFN